MNIDFNNIMPSNKNILEKIDAKEMMIRVWQTWVISNPEKKSFTKKMVADLNSEIVDLKQSF